MNPNQLKFPSRKTVKEAIEAINSTVWEVYDGSELKLYLKKVENLYFSKLPYLSTFYKMTPDNFKLPLDFYRARPYEGIINEKSIEEYSYNKNAANNGRAHLINHPVFYAAENPFVALLECIQNVKDLESYEGKEFVISKWRANSSGKFILAPFLSAEVAPQNILTRLAQFSKEDFEALGNTINDEEFEALLILKDYIIKMFLTDGNRGVSSYLGHKIIYDNPINNIILIYPSKLAKYHRNNYALHPNFVDENMILEYVYKICINDLSQTDDGIKFNYYMKGIGINDNGIIKWMPIHMNESKFKNLYEKDFCQPYKEINNEL